MYNLYLKINFIHFLVDKEEEDEDETTSMKRKPWGDTSHFCPVVLAELDVLWPGNQEIAVKYKERLYSFSSDEAKEKFTANSERYIAKDRPLVVRSTVQSVY